MKSEKAFYPLEVLEIAKSSTLRCRELYEFGFLMRIAGAEGFL